MLSCTARRKAGLDAAGRFVSLDRQDARLWDKDQSIEAEALLTGAARAGRFGRYQCEAAIQSVHVQRPIAGRLNLRALHMLYDLLVSQSESLGARVGRAIVLAKLGDLLQARAELDAMPAGRVRTDQPWWVARSRETVLDGCTDEPADALSTAVAPTKDAAVREFLPDQRLKLSARQRRSCSPCCLAGLPTSCGAPDD